MREVKKLECVWVCVSELCLWAGKTDLPRDLRTREWKPAGAIAEFRSAACMMAMRALAADDFKNISGLWVSSLLQEGHVFMELCSGDYYVSLGHEKCATLAWKLDVISAARRISL